MDVFDIHVEKGCPECHLPGLRLESNLVVGGYLRLESIVIEVALVGIEIETTRHVALGIAEIGAPVVVERIIESHPWQKL